MRLPGTALLSNCVLVSLAMAWTPAACDADLIFDVTLNTIPLIGDSAAPFYLDFQLNDGSGIAFGNNTATLSNFDFGGGAAAGPPNPTGGASGDLTTSVTISDTEFLNEFYQEFTPGATLKFRVQLTTNDEGGPTPDQFSFAILDNSLSQIPTTDIGGALFTVDLAANPSISTFSNVTLGAPNLSAVPEPSSALMLGLAALMLPGYRYLRSSRAKP